MTKRAYSVYTLGAGFYAAVLNPECVYIKTPNHSGWLRSTMTLDELVGFSLVAKNVVFK